MLQATHPVSPQSSEFAEQLAEAGVVFRRSGVKGIFCAHGTFSGADALGIVTELSRVAPHLSGRVRRLGKRSLNVLLGETGNYTPNFAESFEKSLIGDSSEIIPVELFHWSGQNNHIGRADGAVRLLQNLARFAEGLPADDFNLETPPRVLLWGHSHGGNIFALVTSLLAAEREFREEFFHVSRSFYQSWSGRRVLMPRWQKVRELLDMVDHPLRKLALDIVTFGTPIRYGWDHQGYSKLLHFVHHQHNGDPEHLAPHVKLRNALAKRGDFVHQLGIAGSNFAPLPCAVRTFLADRRLNKFLARDLPDEFIIKRLGYRRRVPDAGTTLLVDYTHVEKGIDRYLAGHTLYTRRKWLPFHCLQIAEHLYPEEHSI